MVINATVECVWDAKAVLGEGPCWDARHNALMWVDIKGQRLHAFDPLTGARRTWAPAHRIFSLDVPPATWTPPASGAQWFVGCSALGFSWIGIDGENVIIRALSHPEPNHPRNRFNDGKVGPDGRYWAGTMDDGESEPTGALYAFGPTGESRRVDENYIVSNGPTFSPDGGTLYHTDSARRTIYAFDLGRDGASNKRVFVRFEDADGYPDGMTTDGDGNLWVAMWEGARLQKLSPGAERLGYVPIPATRPTSCVFADQSTLFVTSASIGAPATDRLAGGLFRVDLR